MKVYFRVKGPLLIHVKEIWIVNSPTHHLLLGLKPMCGYELSHNCWYSKILNHLTNFFKCGCSKTEVVSIIRVLDICDGM